VFSKGDAEIRHPGFSKPLADIPKIPGEIWNAVMPGLPHCNYSSLTGQVRLYSVNEPGRFETRIN
jgi:hypothetical protein